MLSRKTARVNFADGCFSRWYSGSSTMSNITTERRGHVLLIGLNRVTKRNAFDPPMFHDLARAYGSYEADPELRCAVVFAHGPHFTGGIDLAQFAPLFEREDPFAQDAGRDRSVRHAQPSVEASGDGGPRHYVHHRH